MGKLVSIDTEVLAMLAQKNTPGSSAFEDAQQKTRAVLAAAGCDEKGEVVPGPEQDPPPRIKLTIDGGRSVFDDGIAMWVDELIPALDPKPREAFIEAVRRLGVPVPAVERCETCCHQRDIEKVPGGCAIDIPCTPANSQWEPRTCATCKRQIRCSPPFKCDDFSQWSPRHD